MNKKMKALAGVLAMTLLTGCGAFRTPDPNDMAYQTAGVAKDTPLATVDGHDIQAERILFWLSSAIQSEEYYGGPIAENDWATKAEQLKSDALDTAVLYQVVENKAAEYGVVLFPEQEEKLAADITTTVNDAGGEEAFQKRLKESCISFEGYEALSRVGYLYTALRNKLEADEMITVTDSDIDNYIEENGIYGAKHILISTRRVDEDSKSYEEFSDAEKAEALAKANDLRARLTEAGDSEELFDELMKEYSEDGRDENGNLYTPEGYTYVYPGQMVSEFEEGATALKVGEISEPIQSQFGYHIILRVPVDREQAKAQYGSDYKFGEMIDSWVNEAKVTTTKVWDELDVKSFYEKLTAIREADAAAESAAPETSGDVQPETSESVQPESTETSQPEAETTTQP